MSNLSELLPAGAGAKSATFVASGTLPSGQTVALKTNGQVEAVAVTGGLGTAVQFAPAVPNYINSSYDSNTGKVVVFFSDGSIASYVSAIVGTVSGTSISFGTIVVVSSAASTWLSSSYDSTAQKIVVAWTDSAVGKAKVGTVSGTSISFGAEATFNNTSTIHSNCVYDPNANKTVIAYRDVGDSNYGKAIVGTISGTGISFGTEVTFDTAFSQYPKQVYDANAQKISIIYQSYTALDGKGIVGTVSGTSISFGTATQFTANLIEEIGGAYDSVAQKVVYSYRDTSNSNVGTAVVGTISGTSISFGTPVVFTSNNVFKTSTCFNVSSGKVVLVYQDITDSNNGKLLNGTVSGTSISFSSSITYNTSGFYGGNFVTYNSGQGSNVISYGAAAPTYLGLGIVEAPAGSNNTSFIGITDEAISSAASGSVVVQGGVITNTGLIPVALSLGTGAVFESASTNYISSAFDSTNNKVVHAYNDGGNSGYGTVIVGTVSGSSITYGSPVVFSTTNIYYPSIAYDSANNRVVIAYLDAGNSSYGTAIVGTVSGTSISFGTAVVFNAAAIDTPGIGFDSNENKVVIAYRDDGNSNYGTAIVGTVSGTSISFGTEVVYKSSKSEYNTVTFDSSNNKVVVAYTCTATNGTASVGTVSGTSISFGTAVAFNPTRSSNYLSGAFDSNSNKVVLYYSDSPTAAIGGMCVVGTVSGTSISFGTAVAVGTSTSSSFTALSFDSSVNKIMMAYRGYVSGAYLGRLAVGTVSGTSITIADTVTFNAGNTPYNSLVFDSNANKTVLAYMDVGNSQYGTSLVISFSSDLVIGTDYFVQTDGSLSTTSSTVPAGRALSTTSMLLEG